MTPPRIDRLFDHVVRIWRPATAPSSRLGVETRNYAIVGQAGAALNRNVSPEGDVGPGMMPIGRRRLYMRPDANVKARDVVEIIEGPEAAGVDGKTWEVDQPPTRPRGHHTQVDAVAWNGVLPPIGS